jgi:ribosomal protein S18 acetylase RimI-like enzyme
MIAPKDRPRPDIVIRQAAAADLDALVRLENRVFSYDQMSRASFRRFLEVRTAAVLVAERAGIFAGYAVVLSRPGSRAARLYSIAVATAGQGIGPKLLAAAEKAAQRRRCTLLRLEVHENNAAAIGRYRKSGYVLTGRRDGYYTDGGNALRFEKRLLPLSTSAKDSASPRGLPAR